MPSGYRTPERSPQRGAPGSPNKRRRFLQTTDDNTGEMTIEQFNYRSDEYRSSTARPVYPFPMHLVGASTELSDRLRFDTELRQDLHNQLALHYVHRYSAQFFWQSKPDYPGGEKPVLALHLCVDSSQQSTLREWSPAKRTVQSLLEEHGLEGTEVELYDPQRCYEPTIHPISPDDHHIRIYESCRQRIIEYVDRCLTGIWRSMSIYKVRANPSLSALYEVIIIVDPFARFDWATLCSNIKAILNRAANSADGDINVQVIPGYCSQNPSGQDAPGREGTGKPGRSFRTTLRQLPQMGSSIGVVGERGGGTLGGYMSLAFDGKVHRGFLTNSHVVEPAAMAETRVITRYITEGVSIQSSSADPVRSKTQWMAIKDFEATKSDILEHRQLHMRRMAEAEKTREEYQEIGRRHIVKDNIINNSRRELQSLAGLPQIYGQMPRPIGSVLFATGWALSPSKHILDVAFVSVPSSDQALWNHCVLDNELPNGKDSEFFGRLPQNLKSPEVYSDPPRITGYGPLIKGNWYFKIGRTTDLTSGICHGTEAYISLGGIRSGYYSTWKRGAFEDVVYTEESIIISAPEKVTGGRIETQDFCASGDSGSLIIDADGQVVAQLFGSLHGCCERPKPNNPLDKGEDKGVTYYSQTGMVTPIDRILEAVKMMTAPRDAEGRQTGEGAILDILG